MITLEFKDYYFITVYTPNSQEELKRLSYRMKWEDDFLAYLKKLEQNKPVIFCGDLNVAHREIDLKIQKQTVRTPVLQMKKERNFLPLYMQALQIPSGIFILTWKELIPGGPTGLKPEKKCRMAY